MVKEHTFRFALKSCYIDTAFCEGDAKVGVLSGGERRRVAIARLVLERPQVRDPLCHKVTITQRFTTHAIFFI